MEQEGSTVAVADMVDLAISPIVVWSALGFATVVYLIISIFLVYHWKRYGMGSPLIRYVEIAYFVISISLLLVAVVSAVVYSYA